MGKKANLIVGAGDKCADLRYASGLSTSDNFIWIGMGGKCRVIVSALEFDRAKESCPGKVEVVDSAALGGGSLSRQIKSAAEAYGIDGFLVPEYFPVGLAEALREMGVAVSVGESDFFPGREFKSKGELKKIVSALRAAENGMRRAFEVLADAAVDAKKQLWYDKKTLLTSEILRREIDVELLRSEMLPGETIAAGGAQGAQPHNRGSGVLFAGSPIVIDIFPRDLNTGYWGDLTRTVVKGKAGKIAKKAYAAVKAARDIAKENLCAGADPSRIHAMAVNYFEEHDFFTGENEKGYFGFFHSLGHGVGLDIHEAPRLGPGNRNPLKGGEVVTVEPGLYYPEWGGIRLEDMVYITPSGAELLTGIDDFLELE